MLFSAQSELIATEPINAGSGIGLADGESYDVTMALASEA
jgi:hypothetical protein